MRPDHEELLLHFLFELRAELKQYLSPEEIKQVERAFFYGESHHRGQTRKTGEPYITQPVAVAKILAELRLDVETVVAAILHDVIEDTTITKADIEAVSAWLDNKGKTEKEIGFRAGIPLDEGLRRLIEWRRVDVQR